MNLLQAIETDLAKKQINQKTLWIYILFAYLFSIAIRLFLYFQVSDIENYFYNDHIIPLWTTDSGLYGYYAKQLLGGVSYPLVSEYIPGYLLYWLVSITGLDIDTVLFFSPAFLASLIVVPIILLAHHYRLSVLGLYAAVIGSVMTSYYYRTHLGYYDTDILNAFFPLLSIYFLIRLVDDEKFRYGVFASLSLIGFHLWYHSSLPIILAIVGVFFIYLLLFKRKIALAYQSLFLLAVALLPLAFIYKTVLVFVLAIVFWSISKYREIEIKHYLFILFAGVIALSLVVNLNKYYERVEDYISKSSAIEVSSEREKIKFKADLDSVIEAKSISLSEVMHRVSGAAPFFVLALLGYIGLLVRYRSMLLTLPLVALTFVAMAAGLRFTMYGVMLFSFSLVISTFLIFHLILTRWGEFSELVSKVVSNIFLILVIAYALSTVVKYNRSSIDPILFNTTDDIKALDEFQENFTENDFMLTWWDYGWPLWYYLNSNNTLIDNGKHQQDNFIVSKILLSDNDTFVRNASQFFVEKYHEGRGNGFAKVMDYFVHKYSMKYLSELKKEDILLPKTERKIYILLHNYMLTTLGTIESFSNINHYTGAVKQSDYIDMGYLSEKYSADQKLLKTFKFTVDKQQGMIRSEKGDMKFKKLSIIENNEIVFDKSYLAPNGSYVVVYNGKVLLMKENIYNSFLVQTLVFQNYDKSKFEKITQTDNFTILRVNTQ